MLNLRGEPRGGGSRISFHVVNSWYLLYLGKIIHLRKDENFGSWLYLYRCLCL